MADKKITQLTNITGANLVDADEFVVVDISADETKAITLGELKEAFDAGSGFVRVTGDTMTGDLSFGDNDKAIFGAGSDLQIYHDGSNSYVKDAGDGTLNVQGSSQVNIGGANGTVGVQFVEGANVTLRHNNSPKLTTTSTGLDVTGTITSDGLTVGGTNATTDLKIQGNYQYINNAPFSLSFQNNYTGGSILGSISSYLDGAVNSGALLFNTASSGSNTEAMRINSSGNVGIGTSSPAAKLHVQGTYGYFADGAYNGYFGKGNGVVVGGGAADLGISTSTGAILFGTGGSLAERMRIDSSGNVGIGTSSPATTLDVTGTITTDGLTVGAATRVDVDGNEINMYNSNYYLASVNTDDADNTLGLTLESGFNGDILFKGYNGSTSSTKGGGAKRFFIEGTTGDISFYEDTGTTAKFFWDASAERLGIGTSSPAHALHVASSSANSVVSYVNNTDTANGNGILVRGGGSNSGKYVASFQDAAANTRMQILANGSVGIGTSSLIDATLKVLRSSNSGYGIEAEQSGTLNVPYSAYLKNAGTKAFDFRWYGTTIGSITNSGGTSIAYNTSSDYRLKEDWQPMTGASDRVLALNPVNFAWKADGSRVDGFLAHEVQAVVPECATGTKDAMMDEEYEVTSAVLDDDGSETTAAVMGTRSVPDYQGIDQSKLVPLLTAALQEALTEITALKARVTALEG